MRSNLNTYWAKIVVEELVRCGVERFCICPGSRSTPLTVAAARNTRAATVVCYDERAAGFYALGLARACGKPAAVITTSGTAAANLLPAVAESSVDKVPLILLTADRPPELSDTGANQTLNQPGMFAKFTRWQFDMPCPDEAVPPQMVLTTVDQAVYRAAGVYPGPVHLNWRFREPLEPADIEIDRSYTADISAWSKSDVPFTTYEHAKVAAGADTVDAIVRLMNATDRGMVMVGRLDSQAQRNAVTSLIEKLGWCVYADITSGLRLGPCGTNVIRHFDQELLSDEFNARSRPQFVLHLGKRTTSKRIGLFFTENRPEHYVVVKADPDRYDPVHAVTQHIQADVAGFCSQLAEKISPRQTGDFANFYKAKAKAAQQIIAQHIEAEKNLSEPFVAREISARICDKAAMYVSSSMPVRDMDLYSGSSDKYIPVGANRGISGIDGVIATACGFAAGHQRPITLLIGDLAFLHDVNSLALAARSEYPVTIVVINNHGGGIFDFLPISGAADVFEEFFATPHEFCFGGVCETFGLEHKAVTTKRQFTDAYVRAGGGSQSTVIEVAADRKTNLKLRRDIKKAIIQELEK